MNTTLDPALDRSGTVKHAHNRSISAFQGLISDCSLSDIYRAVNPIYKMFTFYSGHWNMNNKVWAFQRIGKNKLLPLKLN